MRLFLDACTLIYRFEGASQFRQAATTLIAQLTADQPVVEVAVSRLSVMECRVKPLRESNTDLLQRYANFFAAVQVLELGAETVDLATEMRAEYGLKTSDALQAACALQWQRDSREEVLFVTADTSFAKIPSLAVRLIAA